MSLFRTSEATRARRLAVAIRRLRREEDGVGMVIFAMGMLVMLGMCALTIDVGRYFEMRRQLQNAADAAVHAGAQVLPDTAAAEAEAIAYFDLNAPSLGTNSISFAYPGVDNERMEIVVDAEVPFVLAPIFGVLSADAEVRAMAGAQTSDIVVVIDRSGSMCHDTHPSAGADCPSHLGDEPITATKSAALLFADEFSPGYAKLGLVTYATTGTTDLLLTTDFDGAGSDYYTEVGTIMPDGNTNIGHGIRLAREELESGRARVDSVKVIVLMSDGIPNRRFSTGQSASYSEARNYAEDQAELAADEGFVIYTIGLGAGADHDLMEELAEIGGGEYVYAPSSAEIGATFQQIANLVKVRILQ